MVSAEPPQVRREPVRCCEVLGKRSDIQAKMGGSAMYRFDDFEFDPVLGQLRRGGEPVELPPRAAFVLECLLGRAGELVSKDELLDFAWKDTSVTEHSLIEAIKVLRRVLGDQSSERRYVQTVHRRGYRFIAPVSVGQQPMEATPSALAPGSETSDPHGGGRPGVSGTLRTGVFAHPFGIAVLAVTVLLGALAVRLGWLGDDPSGINGGSGALTQRFAVALPEAYPLWRGESIAISPDGRFMAYVGRGDVGVALLVKETPRLDWTVLFEAGAETSFPVFSPDSRWIAFVAKPGAGEPSAIRRIRVTGGPAETVFEGEGP